MRPVRRPFPGHKWLGERDRQTQKDGQTDRDRQKQVHTHTDRQTDSDRPANRGIDRHTERDR